MAFSARNFSLTAEEPNGADAGIATGTLDEGGTLELDVTFNGTGTVSGTALDSSGALLASGRVRLTRAAPFVRDVTATVDPNGVFQFGSIPVGDYNLSLTVTGLPLRGSTTGNISVDGATDNPVIQLADAGNVVGILVKPDGAGGTVAAPNVPVTASGSFLLSTLTDSTGTFRIEGLPLGDFSLRAEDPITNGLAIVSATMSTNGEELELGTLELDIDPLAIVGISPANGALGVVPDATIAVTLTDPVEPNSVPGRVFVRSGGSNLSGATSVSPDGLTVSFTVTVALPSSSTIEVFVSKDLAETLGRRLGEDFTSSFETGAAVVTGLVLDQGVPVPGTSVTLTAGGATTPGVSDADGRYRFENVAVGSVSIVATNGSLSGSIVVDVGPNDGLLDTNINLAFVASLAGQVFEFDGVTPASSGLEVRVSQNNADVGLGTTQADGTYQIDNIPLGPFTVDVTKASNGDRGQASGALDTPNVIVSGVDVTLTGAGSVRVVVEDTQGQTIEGAAVTLGFSRFNAFTLLEGTTLSDGAFVFDPVLAGGVSLTALDPATNLQASDSGTAVANVETLITLVLEPTGAIEGTVTMPLGAPAAGATVRVYRESGNVLKGETTTASDGSYGFVNLPAPQSPYRVDVLSGAKLLARTRGVTVPENGTVTVDLELTGLGTVIGAVVPPGVETLSSSVVVTLTSLVPELGGVSSDTGAADGTYEIAEVPVGPFRLSARDSTNGFLGEAEGVVTSDGETVTVDIQLIDNAVTFPGAGIRKLDANGYDYRIRSDGALRGGQSGLFEALEPGAPILSVAVDGGSETLFTGGAVGSEEDGGREIATASELIDGVRVQRKIAVPIGGYFARYLESFENESGAPVVVSVSLESNINNRFQGFPRVVDSSNGDAVAEASDVWVITDDGLDADPFISIDISALGFVMADGTGVVPADVMFAENIGNADGQLQVSYSFTIPVNGRVVLMHFVALELSRFAAVAASERLVSLPPEALVGLSGPELGDIVNFAVPADGVSSVAPLPALDGRINGRFLAHDGTTEVGTATGAGTLKAIFQSDHVLFRRIRDVSSSTGRFRFAAASETEGFVIPRTRFTLTSTKRAGLLTTTANAAGSFVGPSVLSDVSGISVSASSESSSSVAVTKAFDRNTGTYWAPSISDPEPRPFIDVVLDAFATVDEVLVIPQANASVTDVQVQLFDSGGLELASLTEPFVSNDPVTLSFASTPNVEQVVASFTGAAIRIAELELRGTTTTDIGSAAADLVFADSASLDVTVTSSGGTQVGSDLAFKIVNQNIGTVSGTDGRFFFAPVPVSGDDVTIIATATAPNHNFLQVTQDVPVSAGQTATPVLVFPAAALVSGIVTDHTGAPVVNRSVTLFPESGGNATIKTDGTGRYTFTEVPSGNHRLRVVDSGRILHFPIVVNAPTALTQDIQIPILRDVALTVLFERTDPTAQPAAFALIEVKDTFDDDFRFPLFTNASGQKTLPDIAGGPYTIRVRHPSVFTSITDFVETITAPGPALPLTLTIPSFGSLSGTVTFADGTTPASGAAIELTGTDIMATGDIADGAGGYGFTIVRAARPFTLLARHPAPNRDHIVAEVQDGTGIAGQGESQVVSLTLPATGTVNVLVTEEDMTTPVTGVDILFLDSFSTAFRTEGATGGDGQRSITTVPEGAFTVRVELSGQVIEAVDTIVQDGDAIDVTIVRLAGATVEGQVFGIDSQTPVPSATVELRSSNGVTLFDTTTTDSEGAFVFNDAMDPGESRLVRALFTDDTSQQVEEALSATEPGELFALSLDLPVSVIVGRVLESDGVTPVANASVEVDRQIGDSFEFIFETADADGNFAFFNQEPGTFELFAEDDFALSRFERVELPSDTLTLVQDIVLPPFGTVQGTVTDSTGSPVAFPEVALRNANVFFTRKETGDASGNYRFDRVAVGSYSVTFTQSGVSSSSSPLSATAVGRVDEGELELAHLVLPGVGTVFGQLATTPIDPTAVASVESRGQESEAFPRIFEKSETVGTDGTYRVEGAPVGDVTITIDDAGAVGAAVATVVEGGETMADVTLGTATGVPIALELDPTIASDGFTQIDVDGVLLGESGFELGRVWLNAS